MRHYSGTEKSYLVAAACREHVGAASLRRISRLCLEYGTDISDIARFTAFEFQREAGINEQTSKRLARMEFPMEYGEQVIDQIEDRGGEVIFDVEPAYPADFTQFLGHESPPVLFAFGAVGLMQDKCIGIVGSRRPSRPAAKAAYCFSTDLAQNGWTIVSGAARGIDTCGHSGALEVGGGTVILPPLGILKYQWDKSLVHKLDDGKWCVVSPFSPFSGWKTRNALIRNKMIIALSHGVAAFEPRNRGGTWHSATTALQMHKPLFVSTYRKDFAHKKGAELLIKRGAYNLSVNNMPSGAEFAAMLDGCDVPAEKNQPELF